MNRYVTTLELIIVHNDHEFEFEVNVIGAIEINKWLRTSRTYHCPVCGEKFNRVILDELPAPEPEQLSLEVMQ